MPRMTGAAPAAILADPEMWKYAMIFIPSPALPAAYHLELDANGSYLAGPEFIEPRPTNLDLALLCVAGPAAGTRRGRPFELRRGRVIGSARAERS